MLKNAKILITHSLPSGNYAVTYYQTLGEVWATGAGKTR